MSLDLAFHAICWFLLLFLAVERSRSRLLWSDEILSAVLLREPFGAMLRGWWNGADGGGLFFYVLGWLWVRMTGASDLSLRLFSAVPLCLSFSLIVMAARRYYSLLAVAVGATSVYFVSAGFSWHLANARFYGLFLAACAWAIHVYFRAAQNDDHESSALCLQSFAAHLMLSGTQILGALCSAAILSALIVLDRGRGRQRLRLYLSCSAGWLILLPSAVPVWNSAQIGSRYFWTEPPTWDVARSVLSINTPFVEQILVVCLLLLGTLWVFGGGKHTDMDRDSAQERKPVLLLVIALYAAAFIIVAKSSFGTSLVADRYILPCGFAALLLVSELVTRIVEYWRVVASRSVQIAGVLLILGITFALAEMQFPYEVYYPKIGYVDRLLSRVPSGATVVIPYHWSVFADAIYYGERFHQDLVFPIDDRSTPVMTMGLNLARAWGKSGVYAGHTPNATEFLETHPEFYVFVTEAGEEWWKREIHCGDRWTCTPAGEVEEFYKVSIWKVTRKGPDHKSIK